MGDLVPVVNRNVPLTIRVRERIRGFPVGETFTRDSVSFEDLGSRDAVVQALKALVHRGELVRVAWGQYAQNDSGARPMPVLSVRAQVLQRIEALVPEGGEFTVRSLELSGSLRLPRNALADLAREGAVTRVARGSYLKKPGPVGSVVRRSVGRSGMMRAYITQHLWSGQAFEVGDLPDYGPRPAMSSALQKLKKAGFLLSPGRGRYSVAQEGGVLPSERSVRDHVRAEVLSFPHGRTFGLRDVERLVSRDQASSVLHSLVREGTIVRAGRSSYVVAGGSSLEYVSFKAQILQRIRALPIGQTVTRGACGMFDDLGSRRSVECAINALFVDGELIRVARGRYALSGAEGQPSPVVLRRGKATVPRSD